MSDLDIGMPTSASGDHRVGSPNGARPRILVGIAALFVLLVTVGVAARLRENGRKGPIPELLASDMAIPEISRFDINPSPEIERLIKSMPSFEEFVGVPGYYMNGWSFIRWSPSARYFAGTGGPFTVSQAMRLRAFHAGIIDVAGPLTDFEIVLFDHTGQSDSDTKTVVFPGELGRVSIPFQTLDSEEGVELVPGRSYDLGYVFTVTDCRIPVALRGGVVEVDTGGGWRRMTYLRGGSITWYPRDCPTLDPVAASVSNSQFVSFATAGQPPTR